MFANGFSSPGAEADGSPSYSPIYTDSEEEEATDARDGTQEAQDARAANAAGEAKWAQEAKEAQRAKEATETQEAKETKEAQEEQEAQEAIKADTEAEGARISNPPAPEWVCLQCTAIVFIRGISLLLACSSSSHLCM